MVLVVSGDELLDSLVSSEVVLPVEVVPVVVLLGSPVVEVGSVEVGPVDAGPVVSELLPPTGSLPGGQAVRRVQHRTVFVALRRVIKDLGGMVGRTQAELER